MSVKTIYKPNQHEHTKISSEQLKKSYRTLIGKPVKLNFKEEVGPVIDIRFHKNDELEIIMKLPDLRGEYIAQGITDIGQALNVIFNGLSMILSTKEGKINGG